MQANPIPIIHVIVAISLSIRSKRFSTVLEFSLLDFLSNFTIGVNLGIFHSIL